LFDQVPSAMGKILEVLTPEWVEQRLAAAMAPQAPNADQDEKTIQMALRVALKFATADADRAALEAQIRRDAAAGRQARAQRETDPAHRLGSLLSDCIRVCEYQYASGALPSVIHERCRLAAERAIDELPGLDYSIKHVRVERMLPSSARSLAERFGGTWWKAEGQYAGVEYSHTNEPLHQWTRLALWYVAALTGDPALARNVGCAYKALPLHKLGKGDIREAILRCALAGDTECETALADRLEPGYPADLPSELIDLPLGVIRRDGTMILNAVRKLGNTFKRKWDVKAHRAWYDKRQPRDPARSHPNGTWEQFVERTKEELFALHWVFSWWAIAWLQVARSRGINELFEPQARKAFSEWVPLALVVPE
jgi:hypothetical protein